MKSVRTDPHNHAPEGDEQRIDFGSADYWEIIEAALVGLPEHDPFRGPALRSLDHLRERVTENQSAPTHGDKP